MDKKTPNATDKHVGARVRMRRMMLNMSQETLGDAVGLTFQQIQKYEKGTNRIGASRLMQIAGALNVGPMFFFEGLPRSGAPAAEIEEGRLVTEFFTTSGAATLARLYIGLDPKARGALLEAAACMQHRPALVRKAS